MLRSIPIPQAPTARRGLAVCLVGTTLLLAAGCQSQPSRYRPLQDHDFALTRVDASAPSQVTYRFAVRQRGEAILDESYVFASQDSLTKVPVKKGQDVPVPSPDFDGVIVGRGTNPNQWRALEEGKETLAKAKLEMDKLAPKVAAATQRIAETIAAAPEGATDAETQLALLESGVTAIRDVSEVLSKAIETEVEVRKNFDKTMLKLNAIRAELRNNVVSSFQGIDDAAKVLAQCEDERKKLAAAESTPELERKLDECYDKYRDWTRLHNKQRELHAHFVNKTAVFDAEVGPLQDVRDSTVDFYHDMRDLSSKLAIIGHRLQSQSDLQDLRRAAVEMGAVVAASRAAKFGDFFQSVDEMMRRLEKTETARARPENVTAREVWKRAGPHVAAPSQVAGGAR